MNRLVWVAIALAACKSKPEPSGTGAGSAVAPKQGSAAADAATAPAHAAKPPPTKEQRAEYRKHVKAGWALQKATKWAESVPEFEAAVAAIPDDQRALAELGFSAMNAGDFAKARKADEQAIRVAIDPKVKAAGLYNLGLVNEKLGDHDAALKAFLASLELRPNKTVEQAVGRLGATPTTEPPFCAAGKQLCDCIITDVFGDSYDKDHPPACAEATAAPPPVKGFHVYEVHDDRSGWVYLFDEHMQFVVVMNGGRESTRSMSALESGKTDVKTVGGHQVLWLETTYKASETMVSGDDEGTVTDATVTQKRLTVCVIGDATTPTRCPPELRDVTMSIRREQQTMTGEKPDLQFKNDVQETKLDIALADDGTLTVKLVSGASAEEDQLARVIGPHKLW